MNQLMKHIYPFLPGIVTERIAASRDHLRVIDLSRVELLRTADRKVLADPAAMEDLLPKLGLSGSRNLVPEGLRQYAGTGLWHWQHPKQFSRYLVQLSALPIKSYLEIGVKYGGTFVITVEYLSLFQSFERALGVDANFCPSLVKYAHRNPKAQWLQVNTREDLFRTRVESSGGYDLVLIDGDHAEDGCRKDFEIVKPYANVVVFHDIVNEYTPGPGVVWREVKAKCAEEYDFTEYTDQYPDIVKEIGKKVLGLGVAVRKGFAKGGL